MYAIDIKYTRELLTGDTVGLYGGIDLHANNSVIVLLNEQDQVIYQRRLANHLSTIMDQLGPYHTDIQGVVVESTYNWYAQFIAVCRRSK